jgi:hypothetical protein
LEDKIAQGATVLVLNATSSGDITEPCPVPLSTDRHDPVFQDTRLKPFLDQTDDALVAKPDVPRI